MSCVDLYDDLSPRGNIIGKNAIGCYRRIILYEPKVSAGCITPMFLEFHFERIPRMRRIETHWLQQAATVRGVITRTHECKPSKKLTRRLAAI